MTENQKLREALLSDMDIAVLRMPVHLAFAGNMAQFQYHNRVQSLLNRIDALALPTADHLPDAGEMVEAAAPVCEREAFEREMSKPPFEFCMDRWPDDGSYAWPGNYAAYHTQCAWAAWQARAALSAGDADPLTRYRVWPDGTVQEGSESPHAWMSDDFGYVDAVDEEQAALSAAMRKDKP